jgi:hypothetical protein
MIPDDLGIEVSDSVRKLVEGAVSEAAQLGQAVGPEHLALAFLNSGRTEWRNFEERVLGFSYQELRRILIRDANKRSQSNMAKGDIEALIRSAAERARDCDHPMLEDIHVAIELACSSLLAPLLAKRRWWYRFKSRASCEDLAELCRLSQFDGKRWRFGEPRS